MARSLQELIDFLLGEVALCGNQGATISTVLQAIETFYNNASKDATQLRQTVDRPFKAKVWTWLTQHPEVSVGQENEWQGLSLDEAEKLDREDQGPRDSNGQEIETETSSTVAQIRIFVPRERTWHAVAGHGPDETKLPHSEFVLLSIIAVHRSAGIDQVRLVKLSGQDKRSVPKRTDALQRKGYIEKRAVQIKSARTSLCTHKRFLKDASDNQGHQKSQIATHDKNIIDFEAFTTKLFEILRKEKIISRNDLKKLLGFQDRWRWKILSRAIRKFERMGVVERVRAESQYEKLHPCVVLRREPNAKDISSFHEFNGGALNADVDDQADDDEDMEIDTVQQTSGADNGDVDMDTGKHLVKSVPLMPIWTPDRHVTNQVFDIIDRSGPGGVTNLEINKLCFGSFYRRPSESLLHRLTDCWQLSQPLHLRHYALLRDQDIQKTIIFYRNFSIKNFAERVKTGITSWEAVEFNPGSKKKNAPKIPGPEAKAQLDQYGFPQTGPPAGLMKGGRGALYQGLLAANPKDYKLTNHDPAVILLPNGEFAIRAGNVKPYYGGIAGTPGTTKPHGILQGPFKKRGADEVDEEVNDINLEDTSTQFMQRPKISKAKFNKLAGLSKKERFEAMGMDNTWTEYNALLMDKPSPGVYVTPEGKRRPAGKRQGRPRKSRIAVFKSPNISNMPWFVKEDSDIEKNTVDSKVAGLPQNSGGDQPVDGNQQSSKPHPQTSIKRPPTGFNNADSPSPSKKPRGEPIKSKTEKLGDIAGSAMSSGTEAAIDVSEIPNTDVDDISTQADVTAKHPLSTEDTHISPNKRQRITSPGRAESEIAGSVALASHTPLEEEIMGPPSAAATTTAADTPNSETRKVRKVQPKRAEKGGGSINLLRRKIVMDIVEKAGGAYPSGHEIWYPFVTEWMRLKFKEKPDLRTVKMAIKHLVDAGKLRQLTFSGKDPCDVMVTKTMVTKPEMSPDDPFVKEMQKKVLATDRSTPKVSYSPNVVLDPSISKHSSRATGQKQELRVEEGAIVQLQSKPAFVVNSEKRRNRRVEMALYKRVVGHVEPHSDNDDLDIPGTSRLMQIQRPPAAEEFAPGSHHQQTIIFRPKKMSLGQRQKGERDTLSKRIVRKISGPGGFSLIMSPQQTFQPSSGTFATQGIAGQMRRLLPRRLAVPDPVRKLSQLAMANPDQHDFHRTSDRIARWEIGHEELLDTVLPDETYISQTVRNSFYGAPIDGQIRFDVDEPELAPLQLPTPMRTRKRGRRKQRDYNNQERRLEKVDTSTPASARFQPTLPATPRPTKRRTFQPIPEALLRKIMLAIVAVRVLTGGTEARHVDWDLVAACFPGHDASSLIDRARNVLNRNRLQIMKMQNDFQDRFLKAYANDQVPTIDYTDLDSYPWPTLIEWANFQLEVSTSERAPSLPATREQFDDIFALREEPVPTADEIFTTTVGMTLNYRRGVLAQTAFSVMLDDDREAKHESHRQQELKREEITKTFVRANIVTPEDTYDPAKSNTILERFGEKRIQSAVESLMKDRVIGQNNRGRVAPGRNFDITDHLLQQLNRRRMIECGILKQAAAFKISTLDLKMWDEGVAEVQYNAEDGHILAMINLFTNGHVELFPRGAPRDKFGLVDDGYLTRQMDKTKLRFAVDVKPTASYVYGNPIEERVTSTKPPALSPLEPGNPQKIPLWMDLNGHLVQPLWEMGLASVIGCLVLREGLSAKGISSMIKPAMAPWEIEMMLGWLTDIGVVQGEDVGSEKRWKVQEWWWMVL